MRQEKAHGWGTECIDGFGVIPGFKSETWGNRHPTLAAKTKTPRGWGTQSFLAEALGEFVGGDLSVADMDHAMGVFGDVRLVGDYDDGVAIGVEGIEQGHDLQAGFGVEV